MYDDVTLLNLDELIQTLLPRWQLQLAQVGVNFIETRQQDAIRSWLASLPINQNSWDELGLSWVVRGDRIRWMAAGNSDVFIPMMADYFMEVGISASALEKLSILGSLLNPDQLGYWLETRPDGLNTGWYFIADIPLSAVGDLFTNGRFPEIISKWAARFNLTQLSRLGQSLGTGNPYRELQIPLSSLRGVDKQVYAALQLLAKLPAQAPSDDALSFLMNGQHDGLTLSLSLTENGVIKAGLMAQNPDTMLMLDLCTLAGMEDITTLARMEGALLTDGPIAVECQTRADGFAVELHYSVDIN